MAEMPTKQFGSTRLYNNITCSVLHTSTSSLIHEYHLETYRDKQENTSMYIRLRDRKTHRQVKKIQINMCFFLLLLAESYTYDPSQEIIRYS